MITMLYLELLYVWMVIFLFYIWRPHLKKRKLLPYFHGWIFKYNLYSRCCCCRPTSFKCLLCEHDWWFLHKFWTKLCCVFNHNQCWVSIIDSSDVFLFICFVTIWLQSVRCEMYRSNLYKSVLSIEIKVLTWSNNFALFFKRSVSVYQEDG